MGDVRALLSRSPRLSRTGTAEVGERARLGGKRINPRLGAVCRRERSQHRHGDVRRLRAAEGAAEEVRLHLRKRHRSGEATDRESEVSDAGVFVQFTCDGAVDLPVPGRKYTFGVVKAAQAEAISTSWWSAIAARRALRAHLGADVAAGFSTLRSALLTALGSAPNRSQYF